MEPMEEKAGDGRVSVALSGAGAVVPRGCGASASATTMARAMGATSSRTRRAKAIAKAPDRGLGRRARIDEHRAVVDTDLTLGARPEGCSLIRNVNPGRPVVFGHLEALPDRRQLSLSRKFGIFQWPDPKVF